MKRATFTCTGEFLAKVIGEAVSRLDLDVELDGSFAVVSSAWNPEDHTSTIGVIGVSRRGSSEASELQGVKTITLTGEDADKLFQ